MKFYVENKETYALAGDERGYKTEKEASNVAGTLNHRFNTDRYRVITKGAKTQQSA